MDRRTNRTAAAIIAAASAAGVATNAEAAVIHDGPYHVQLDPNLVATNPGAQDIADDAYNAGIKHGMLFGLTNGEIPPLPAEILAANPDAQKISEDAFKLGASSSKAVSGIVLTLGGITATGIGFGSFRRRVEEAGVPTIG